MSGNQSEVVIVGAGIVGLTTAYRLLQRDKNIKIIVLDKSNSVKGATSYAGAMDIPYFRTEYHKSLVEFSWDWYRNNVSENKFRWNLPILWLLPNKVDKDDLDRYLLSPTRTLGKDRYKDEKWTYPERYSCYEGECYVIDSLAWTSELRRRLVSSGRVKLMPGTEFKQTVQAGNEIRVETYSKNSIITKHIIFCSGPWVNKLSTAMCDFTNSHTIKTKQVSALQVNLRTNNLRLKALASLDEDIYFFPRTQRDSYILSVRHDKWNVDPDEEQVLSKKVYAMANNFLNPLVGKNNWSIKKNRVFMDTYNDQCSPVVMSLPNTNGALTVVTGTHGSGVRLAPGLADEATTLCLESIN